MSPDKCAAIAFTKRDMSHYKLKIAGSHIRYVSSHKFLGVIFDRSMTWSPHIRSLKEKLASYANIFRMMSSKAEGCSVSALLRMYTALCEGLLRYSLPALQGLTKSNIQVLTSMQAKALRVCLGLPKNTSTVGTLTESKRLSAALLMKQEFLRVCLRFAARVQDHPLASVSISEVRMLLPRRMKSRRY